MKVDEEFDGQSIEEIAEGELPESCHVHDQRN